MYSSLTVMEELLLRLNSGELKPNEDYLADYIGMGSPVVDYLIENRLDYLLDEKYYIEYSLYKKGKLDRSLADELMLLLINIEEGADIDLGGYETILDFIPEDLMCDGCSFRYYSGGKIFESHIDDYIVYISGFYNNKSARDHLFNIMDVSTIVIKGLIEGGHLDEVKEYKESIPEITINNFENITPEMYQYLVSSGLNPQNLYNIPRGEILKGLLIKNDAHLPSIVCKYAYQGDIDKIVFVFELFPKYKDLLVNVLRTMQENDEDKELNSRVVDFLKQLP